MHNTNITINSIDPDTIKLILEVAVPIVEELVKRIADNQSLIKNILEKVDQILLRDISSAFDALNDATLTNNEAAKERRLNYAEEQLLRCTGLNANSKNNIGKYSPAYWVGLSHFGLFTVSKLRGDEILAVRHVLKTYVADPETARKNHFPEVYNKVFLPKCGDIKKWYDEKLAEIDKDNYGWRVLGDRALIAGKGLGLGALALLAMQNQNTKHAVLHNMKQSFNELGEEWGEVSPEKHRDEMKEKLLIEYQEKLDNKCKIIAHSMLS
ncbi:MAG: hypothetical protein KME54_24785 [Tolypothrix brevis GSE-NOS-MK-07-07A]|jgi:hypothetical protein|nr:hypothetical protein [Tolypothrix brevis GSE-NOS-MK-07-07A]